MSERQGQGAATVAQLDEFDEILDVRSPAEYAEDCIPGAINCPVLTDDERARVGTLYRQVSPFEARKIGAALVARNVANCLEHLFLVKPREWRPLVYCWRGGQRSGAMVHVLRQIGWDARRLDGGYKAWRRDVIGQLAELPRQLDFQVICGATGSGKSRVLEALAERGAQVLHLEQLAAHKGSVLGNLPNMVQPSQRRFETRLFDTLRVFDPAQPVYVEAESRRIGTLQLPDALLNAIRHGRCLHIEASLPARVGFLLRDYEYFLCDPTWLGERIERLRGLHSNETLQRWHALVVTANWPTLVYELLEHHYDRLYGRSQKENFAGYVSTGACFTSADLTSDGISALAEKILATWP